MRFGWCKCMARKYPFAVVNHLYSSSLLAQHHQRSSVYLSPACYHVKLYMNPHFWFVLSDMATNNPQKSHYRSEFLELR